MKVKGDEKDTDAMGRHIDYRRPAIADPRYDHSPRHQNSYEVNVAAETASILILL